MSADNGIYILKMPNDRARVCELGAVENLYWNYETNKLGKELNSSEVFWAYFREPEMSYGEALETAQRMEQEFYTEYGICLLESDKTWDEIVIDAGNRF
jgi:hypothetical protein